MLLPKTVLHLKGYTTVARILNSMDEVGLDIFPLKGYTTLARILNSMNEVGLDIFYTSPSE